MSIYHHPMIDLKKTDILISARKNVLYNEVKSEFLIVHVCM